MRACPFENEECGFNSVDEQPVWLDMAFSMVVPLTGECIVLVLGWQWCLDLKKVNDGFEFVDIVAPLFGKLEVFEKPASRFEEKHDLFVVLKKDDSLLVLICKEGCPMART